MLIDQVTNAGAMPSLEMTMRFAAQRQNLIAHNIANIETPDFRPLDASPRGFQKMLSEAVDARRSSTGGAHGRLNWRETAELKRAPDGGLSLRPTTSSRNILFHDRNNRDLERLMQDLAENTQVFRTASELMRTQVNQLQRAISERV